jgi:hypothetical protein
MPRNGSGVYSHPFPDVVEGTTIESAVFNGNTSDVEQDLNTPRPIVAGGTGASDAHQALINLHGEESGQVVTNYDTFPFVSGSFWSAPGATSAPNASNYFVGICYIISSSSVVLEARAFVGSSSPANYNYLRVKDGLGWGPWVQQAGNASDIEGSYVNVAGDTMTGSLVIAATDPALVFNKPAGAHSNTVLGTVAGNARWGIQFGNPATESGSNLGSDFSLNRYGDTGAYLDSPININRANGYILFAQGILVNQTVQSGYLSPTVGSYYFGNNGTKYLQFDGTSFNLVGGPLVCATGISDFGNVTAMGGAFFFNAAHTVYLNYSGGAYTFAGGPLNVSGYTITANGYVCRAGVGGATSNIFNIYHGSGQQLYIDTVNVGTFAYTSDYRIKKDVLDLPGMWDTVKALRPIKYTQAQFSPPAHIKFVAEEALKARKEAEENPDAKPREVSATPLYEADDIERWGFIAHELQETLIPSAASGEKDSPDTIQSPNPFTLIAVLTKALQEAMTRIEALEAAP